MKQVINVGKTVGPYSPAIIASGSRHIFISGQIGNDIDADIRTQTTQVIQKIEEILESVDVYLSDIVKTTIYLADISNFDVVNEVYSRFFPSDPPARATLQASALPLNAGIMIEAIAVRD
ncbi:MAG: RidA family protein [Candidatus Hodarchaeota archaeon]